MKKEILMAVCLFGLCFAQTGALDSVVSPSNGVGYMFKEFGRGINLWVVDNFNDEAAQIEARLKIQEEYQLELAKEQMLGNQAAQATIGQRQIKVQNEVETRLAKAVSPQVKAKIQTALQNHEQRLEQVKTQVPEQAQAGIDNAIANANQQQEQAQVMAETGAQNATHTQQNCQGQGC